MGWAGWDVGWWDEVMRKVQPWEAQYSFSTVRLSHTAHVELGLDCLSTLRCAGPLLSVCQWMLVDAQVPEMGSHPGSYTTVPQRRGGGSMPADSRRPVPGVLWVHP